VVKRAYRWDYERSGWLALGEDRAVPVWTSRYWIVHCDHCGLLKATAGCGKRGGLCSQCRRKHYAFFTAISGVAHGIVHKAKKEGRLPLLDGTVCCVDCGKPATVYDHREYAKPLEVDPVCRSCNSRRGPAKELEALWRRTRSKHTTLVYLSSLMKSA
jgi:hypothetical protein